MPRSDFAAFLVSDDRGSIAFAEATLRRYIDGAPDAANAFLEALYVDHDRRRQGIATALLAATAQWAAANGATHVGSNADLDNRASHAWHRAAGFAEVGQTVSFVRPL